MPGIIATLIVTVCAWFLWQISEIVVLFLISLLMFYVIDPLITSIERGLKLNRTGAIMLFYLLCLIVVGLVLWLVLPVVVGQFQTVYSLLTDEAVQADFVNRANGLAARSPIEVPVEELSGSISKYAALALSDIAAFLIDTVDRHLGAYIRGQMAVASSVGSLSALGFL